MGWFGFNAGSALAAGSAGYGLPLSPRTSERRQLLWAGARRRWLRQGKASALGAISGAVAGLVAITPAAGFVTPISAIWIGLIAGVFCYFMVVKVKAIFGYDDSLDAFGVHGAGGTLGAILTGIFVEQCGQSDPWRRQALGLLEGNGGQVINQLIGIAIAMSLSVVGTLIILFLVDKTIGLRLSEDDERDGLDLSQHGEEGYDWATLEFSARGREERERYAED